MALDREELHRIVDRIPNHKLPSVADLLKRIYDEEEEEELTLEELNEVNEAQERISAGEYVTLDELLRKYGDEKDV